MLACVCIGSHVRVRAFGTERDLEALRDLLSGVLEEARAGCAQLAEHVARFPQQVDDLVGEERAIAGEAMVCGGWARRRAPDGHVIDSTMGDTN